MDEASGQVRVAKTSSTPDDPLEGAMNGLDEAKVNLKDVTLLSHGTTMATNALLTRRLPPAAMVCTRGFRDVIDIRRANKEGREILIPATYSRLANLIDLGDGRYEKFRDIATLPVTEVWELEADSPPKT